MLKLFGTISYCGEDVNIIEKVENIEKALKKLEKSKKNKLLIIVQTTFSIKEFQKITNKIIQKINNNIQIEIINTICKATEERQKETEKISKNVDLMIIIGR